MSELPELPATWANEMAKPQRMTPNPATGNGFGEYVNERYEKAVARGVVENLRTTPRNDRNNTLNNAALRAGRMPGVDREALKSELIEACSANKHLQEDGLWMVEGTIESAFAKADADGPAPVPLPVTDREDDAEFWERTDTLRHIRRFAHARMVAPWGMLGVELVRVVTTVPPNVQIPKFVGSRASLNLFVGLVGESGEGKGRTEGAARDAITMARMSKTGPGSGEGINHLFAHYDKTADRTEQTNTDTALCNNGTVFHRSAVWFSVPEVDTLGKYDQRSGSTLLEKLRMAWSGEGFSPLPGPTRPNMW